MANLREEQDLSKHEVGQFWQSSTLGKLDYIPQEALENLECYTTFWDDMEKIEKVVKFDESTGKRKTQENRSFNVSNVQINQIDTSETKETTQKPLRMSRAKEFVGERSCSHCETKDTTQWRQGPLGKKTLCNACGIRYKLNRLVQGYRPAASPSFDFNRHSNFQKKATRKEG